jgi:hypothetical protein
MLKKYIAYLKDNPNGYWFKRKLFGWGWTPVKWQGWLTLAVYLFGIVIFGSTLNNKSSDKEAFIYFVLPVISLTALFFAVAYKKGEKPCWQWGFEKKDL